MRILANLTRGGDQSFFLCCGHVEGSIRSTINFGGATGDSETVIASTIIFRPIGGAVGMGKNPDQRLPLLDGVAQADQHFQADRMINLVA